jgi:hypothetical protein
MCHPVKRFLIADRFAHEILLCSDIVSAQSLYTVLWTWDLLFVLNSLWDGSNVIERNPQFLVFNLFEAEAGLNNI